MGLTTTACVTCGVAIDVGGNRQRRYCVECKKRVRAQTVGAWRRRHHDSRLRFIRAVKETCGCIDCGSRRGRLDFDHRPGTVKIFELSTPSISWRRIVEEIDKCDVRCVSCHVARHHRDRKAAWA